MAEALHLGDFGKTVALDLVPDTAVSFTPSAPASKFLLTADRAVHLSRNGEATTADFKLLADERATVNVRPHNGESLSILLAEGETDGSISITGVV